MTETQDFQLQMMQLLKASCLFSFKSILLRTSGKCQCIKRTACMLNFSYTVIQYNISDIYDLKSVFRGPLTNGYSYSTRFAAYSSLSYS